MLEKNPNKRFQTSADVVAALTALENSAGVTPAAEKIVFVPLAMEESAGTHIWDGIEDSDYKNPLRRCNATRRAGSVSDRRNQRKVPRRFLQKLPRKHMQKLRSLTLPARPRVAAVCSLLAY